jgi:hypothetical protein
VLVRFWSLDHYRPEPVLWPLSPWPKLVYALEGTIQVTAANRVFVLPPNRAIWIEAGAEHPAATLGKARVRTLYFAPDLGVHRECAPIDIRPLFRELIAEACERGPLFRGDGLDEALATLLAAEAVRAPTIPTGIPRPQSPWLREWADEFLRFPLETPPAPYSRRTLERQFLKETGLTYGQWCSQARALAGLRALSLGATVQEAAVEAGFGSTSGFIQSFRKQFGVSPGKALGR